MSKSISHKIILPSFWEKETFLEDSDVAIIGSGITGISAAISLKEKQPALKVVVLDRNVFPLGASTRNAGFACFGSVSELWDDLESSTEEEVFNLLARRMKGLKLLRNRIGDKDLNYYNHGSYELFDTESGDFYFNKIDYLNGRIEAFTGVKNTFIVKNHHLPFNKFNNTGIYNQYEGQLHAGKMMEALLSKAREINVRLLLGASVHHMEEEANSVRLDLGSFSILAKKVIVATNGFAHNLIPELEIEPARNQVLVTESISNLSWKGTFHFDKGYLYFRNIGNRVLIGGARNIDKEKETTTNFELTQAIEQHLLSFLYERILENKSTKIEYKWAGIMGVGKSKAPIIKYISERILVSVRLGGMGVALGSLIGSEVADLCLDYNTNGG